MANRMYVLGRLQRWTQSRAAGPASLVTLGFEDLMEWQQERSSQISPASRRTELSAVREFYRWAMDEELRGDDPSVRIPMPRAPRRMPRPMPESKFELALREANGRTAAILALAGYAGLRAMEIAQLDWSEIDLSEDPPMIRVVDGKGGVGRAVPIGQALVRVLRALPGRRGPVIPRADGHGHNEAARVSQIANEHLHHYGVTETLHQLRHRFATAAYRADNDLRAVQDLLGHASPTTTSAYAATSRGATVRAVAAASFVDSADGVVRREVLLESAAMTARLRWRLAPDDSTTERRVELEVRQVEGPSAMVRLPANREHVLELAASLTMLAEKVAPATGR